MASGPCPAVGEQLFKSGLSVSTASVIGRLKMGVGAGQTSPCPLPGQVAHRRGARPQSGQVGLLSASVHLASRRMPELVGEGSWWGALSGVVLAPCKLQQLLACGFTPSQMAYLPSCLFLHRYLAEEASGCRQRKQGNRTCQPDNL